MAGAARLLITFVRHAIGPQLGTRRSTVSWARYRTARSKLHSPHGRPRQTRHSWCVSGTALCRRGL